MLLVFLATKLIFKMFVFAGPSGKWSRAVNAEGFSVADCVTRRTRGKTRRALVLETNERAFTLILL